MERKKNLGQSLWRIKPVFSLKENSLAGDAFSSTSSEINKRNEVESLLILYRDAI